MLTFIARVGAVALLECAPPVDNLITPTVSHSFSATAAVFSGVFAFEFDLAGRWWTKR